MSGTPSQLLTMTKWAVEKDLFLADFVQRCACPHLALVTKGQYLSVGAPNVANPSLKPYVLIHSTHRVRKVLGQLVRVKEGKKKTLVDHKVAVPESYSGYFEILSEDGRPVKCLESVSDLWKSFPDTCLLRQTCKAYLPDQDGELRSLYRTRTLHEGEVLTLVGQFTFKRIVFLRCFDEFGSSVYLKLNQKGKFSAVAKPDAITGVHSVENLMKKRLPLTVKLIQGPVRAEVQKACGGGPLVMQLQGVFQEDVVFAYSLQRDEGHFLAIPLNAHLKLAPAFNHPQLRVRSEFQRLCHMCDDQVSEFFDRITPFNDFHLHHHQQSASPQPPSPPISPNHGGIPSDPLAAHPDFDQDSSSVGKIPPSPPPPVCDEEIDQLYDYIRGLAPLPDSCHDGKGSQIHSKNYKPPPPPIETIPSRKSADSSNSRSTSGPLPLPPPIGNHRKPHSPTTSNEPNHNNNYHRKPSPIANGNGHMNGNGIINEKESNGGGDLQNKFSLDRYRRMSKSTERVGAYIPFGYNNNMNTPRQQQQQQHYQHPGDEPQPRRMANGGGGGVGGSKRRPLSMVIPNDIPIPRLNSPFVPHMMGAHDYYLRGMTPHHPPHPMYHSFANLSVAEEGGGGGGNEGGFGGYGPSHSVFAPHPPQQAFPFANSRAVYPRFAPRYHQFHQPALYKV